MLQNKISLSILEHRKHNHCGHNHQIRHLRKTMQIGLNWITETFPEAYGSTLHAALSTKVPSSSPKLHSPNSVTCHTAVMFCSAFITSRVASINRGYIAIAIAIAQTYLFRGDDGLQCERFSCDGASCGHSTAEA